MPVLQGEVVSEIQRQLQGGKTHLASVICKCGSVGTLRHAVITSEEDGKTTRTEFVHCCKCTTQYVLPT
jgi:hypothetical protein